MPFSTYGASGVAGGGVGFSKSWPLWGVGFQVCAAVTIASRAACQSQLVISAVPVDALPAGSMEPYPVIVAVSKCRLRINARPCLASESVGGAGWSIRSSNDGSHCIDTVSTNGEFAASAGICRFGVDD